MDQRTYENYRMILREEMIPAMGCTEPIALAYGAAKAREILGREPERILARCSGNIVKNVRCVIIPNSGGMTGIEAAVVLGAVGGDANKEMEVLEAAQEGARKRAAELLKEQICRVELLDSAVPLHFILELYAGSDHVLLEIRQDHLNITRIEKMGRSF